MVKKLQVLAVVFMLSVLAFSACTSNPTPEVIVVTATFTTTPVVTTAPPVVVTATPLPPTPTPTPVPPTATKPPSPDDLEEDAEAWDVYVEKSPTWILENTGEPALSGQSLRCSITGGDPYSNVHCYRNLPSDSDANVFTLSLSFRFPETTCNNENGSISTVQAIEFSMSKWHQATRYEFAVQWENVGEGAPQWRYWHSDEWVSLDPVFNQCLEGDQWHRLVLEGKIVDGQVNYQSFSIDDSEYSLDLTVPPVSAPGEENHLAIAVQLDGNAMQSPYDVFIDEVKFTRKVVTPTPTHTPARTNTPTITSTPTPVDCFQAKITDPVADTIVSKNTTVKWVPATCTMIVQFYQDGVLIREEGAGSGTVEMNVPSGRTEVKIWVLGSNSPADTMWVTVEEYPTPTPTPVDCSHAKITNPIKYPDRDTIVYKGTMTVVEWDPATCQMNVQFYQNGVLINENRSGDASGSVDVSTVPLGRTEIKIWVPGSSSPADTMWVTVEEHPSPTPVDCFQAKITDPMADTSVPRNATVKWVPATCSMIVQFYQNGVLIREEGAGSGTVEMNVPSGRTEVKIWVPGSSSSADTMWVTVE